MKYNVVNLKTLKEIAFKGDNSRSIIQDGCYISNMTLDKFTELSYLQIHGKLHWCNKYKLKHLGSPGNAGRQE